MMQKIEFKVGLFVLIISLLIVTAIGYVAYKKGLFARDQFFTLSSRSGDDLTEGMPVLFSGFKIGRVDALELNNTGHVLITVRIFQDHVKWIRADSIFSLNRPLIGSPRIIVTTKNLSSPPLLPKTIKEILTVNDINDTIAQIQPLVEKVNLILDHMETITADLADSEGNVNKILRNTEKMTSRLSQKDSLLEMTVGRQESVDAVHEALKKTRDILTKVDAMASKTDAQIYGNEGVLPNVVKILKDLQVKLEKLSKTVDNINNASTNMSDATTDFKSLRRDLDAGVKAIGDLANDLDKMIPFKKTPEMKLP